MLEFFFESPGAWFGVPAVAGTALFALRVVLMLLGGAGLDLDVDSNHDGLPDHHGDPTEAFKVLSIQAFAAFAMGFGWGGLAAFHGSRWTMGPSVLVGAAMGAGTVWLMCMVFRGVYAMQASGNVDIQRAIGQRGTIEVLVPGTGRGQGRVTLVMGDKQRSFYAVTQGDDLPTNTPVVITAVNEDNTLSVARP